MLLQKRNVRIWETEPYRSALDQLEVWSGLWS